MEEQTTSEESVRATWIFILVLVLWFLIHSLFTFVLVGDQGPPDWGFNIVKDVPGESPEAIYKKLPHPQHVKGKEGE
jgi:hypothetical protein